MTRPGYWKDLYREHKIGRRALQKLSMAKKPEYYAQYQADYYRNNWASCVRSNAKRRAQKRGVPFTIELKDIPAIPEICPVLGIPLIIGRGPTGGPTPNSPSLDCFKPELGYVPGNVRVISFRANTIKQDSTLAEIEAVARYLRGE
jgi:hypothetical protein